MKLDLKRDVEPERVAERMDLCARTDDHALGRPQSLRGAKEDAIRPLGKLEDLGGEDPLAKSGGEPIHRGPYIDRPAELVQNRLVLRRRHDGQRLSLPLPIDAPRRHAGRLERSGPLRDVRTADEHPLPAEQPNPKLLLEPLPLVPSANSKRDESLIVMTVPKHPRAPGRLPRARSGGLEQSDINSPPLQGVRSRQA